MRTFSLAQVLTAMHGALLCDMGGVYEIMNYLTGDNLFTHQLPRAFRECEPWLKRRHPDLAALDASGVTPENWRTFLESAEARFGQTVAVSPIPRDDHTTRDPVEELAGMIGADRVIVVDPEATP